MIFANVHLGWLFLLVPVFAAIAYVGFLLKKHRRTQFIHPQLWTKIIPSLSASRRFWKQVLLVLGLCLVIAALLRPQYGFKVQHISRTGLDIVIALDTSASMAAQDVKPSRFAQVQSEVKDLIENLKGDRIAVMSFSGVSFVHCPLTIDYAAVKLFLDDVSVGNMPKPGTNLTEVIKQAREILPPSKGKSQAIVLLTDGEDFSGAAIKEARLAAKDGIRIYTIGVGGLSGEPIPIRDENGIIVGYKKDKKGDVVLSKMNTPLLKEIANVTGGQFFHSENGEFVMESLYKVISNQEKQDLDDQLYKNREDRYQIVLFLAFLVLFIERLLPEQKKSSLVWKGRI